MKRRSVLLTFVSLVGWRLLTVAVASDEHPGIGHDEDVHPNALTETTWDVLDIQRGETSQTHWDANKDNPAPPSPAPDDSRNQTFNRTGGSSQCGEYSGQLTSNGQCRLTATLPPVQRRCPDMFRCTDDVSHWLHENQNRKEQLEELRETMSELQEELRNHRHRVKALEMQVTLQS